MAISNSRMLFTPTAREKRENNTSSRVIWIRRCNCVISYSQNCWEDSCWVSSSNLPLGSCSHHIIGVHGVRFRDRVKWKTFMKSNCGLHQPPAQHLNKILFKKNKKLQNTWDGNRIRWSWCTSGFIFLDLLSCLIIPVKVKIWNWIKNKIREKR